MTAMSLEDIGREAGVMGGWRIVMESVAQASQIDRFIKPPHVPLACADNYFGCFQLGAAFSPTMSRGRCVSVDYVIVGAGLFGGVFGRRMAEAGHSVRWSIAVRTSAAIAIRERIDGIEVHRYGPHIFHTNNERVWQFVNRFARFNHYRHRGVGYAAATAVFVPDQLAHAAATVGRHDAAEAERRLAAERVPIDNPQNLEEWALSQVGRELYETFIRGYTIKQWGRDPRELPAAILRRIPIRLTWDDRYFDDVYEGIPIDGYTRLFENLLDHPLIRFETGVDFFGNAAGELSRPATGSFTRARSTNSSTTASARSNIGRCDSKPKSLTATFKAAAIVNYADADRPYTRIVEHKHFALQSSPHTVITREYPQTYR